MAGGPSVRLYRAEWSTNCERVGLALAHKQIEAQSVLIEYSNRGPVEAISGQGLVPVVEDAGKVISDSVAIMRHLDARQPEPPLFPADRGARAGLDVFIEWFERVYKAAPNAIEAELEGDDPSEAEPKCAAVEAPADRRLIARCGAEMAAHVDLFERLLSDRNYLFVELGAADFVAYPFLKYALHREPADSELFHLILDEHQQLGDQSPNLRAWIERMAELPCAY